MADYKESTVAGTSWQRASRVVVDNPYGGVPTIMFVEEQAINIGDSIITKPVANLSCNFDPSATFLAIDPTTNTPTGQEISHGEVYGILYSLYMDLAAKRDGVAIVVPIEDEQPE